MRHRERHPAEHGPVEGCGPCRWRSVQLSAAATPTRTETKPGQRAFMQNFAAEFHNGDREAYKRLRGNNVQPPRIAGSARLEALAETQYEVESGEIAQNPKALREALKIASDGGFNPLVPATTPKAGS